MGEVICFPSEKVETSNSKQPSKHIKRPQELSEVDVFDKIIDLAWHDSDTFLALGKICFFSEPILSVKKVQQLREAGLIDHNGRPYAVVKKIVCSILENTSFKHLYG